MKSTLLTSLLILGVFPFFAQTGLVLNWEKELTNTSGPEAVELLDVEAVSGGVVVVGNTSTADGIRMYVAQYNNAGNLVWDLSLTSTERSSLNWLEVDSQANIYVAGRETVNTASEAETHLAKISSSGQLLWHYTYNGPNDLSEEMNAFLLTDTHLYMCGGEENPQHFQHGWVAKFDLNGNLVWDKEFNPGTQVWLGGLAVDQMGNVSAVGSAEGDYTSLAVQYDAAGNFKWQYPDTLIRGSEQWLSDVKVDNRGNVYALGTEEAGPFFEYDIVTLKLDQNGHLKWKQNFNTGGENGGSILHIGTDEKIYSFGYKEDNFDFFAQMITYDSTGQKLWDHDYRIGGNTYIVGAELDVNNNIFLAVQDFDSLGFAHFSATGNLLAARNYGQEAVDYLSGFSLSGTDVLGTAYADNSLRSQVFSLQKSNLNENFVAEGQGLALSDVRPASLITDGDALWLASYADDGDSASFSITQMDLNGNLVWEKKQRHETSNPTFPHLIHDHRGHVIALYENLITGGNTPIGLVKYDATGNQVFAHYLDSAVTFHAGGLAVDHDNNIFLAAYNETDRRMFLSLYDSTGNRQWTKTYLSPSSTFPYIGPFGIQVSDQNKLVMAAVEKGSDNKNNLHLIQFDLNGNIEWNVEVDYQSSNLVTFSGMEVRSNGDVCVFGSSGGSTWVAACYDQNGDLVWEHKEATTMTGFPRSMVMDDQGNTYLSFSTGTHAYIQKRDATGGLIKDTQAAVATSGTSYFPRQTSLINNQLVILGDHLMPNRSVPFEMLLDANLNLIYSGIDSSLEATPSGIARDQSGNIYSAWAQGDQARQIARRTASVRSYSVGMLGLQEEWLKDLDIQLYPNPASESVMVTLNVPTAGIYQFSLFDLNGRKIISIAEVPLGANRQEVKLPLPAGFPPGIYLVQIQSEHVVFNRKLIVK